MSISFTLLRRKIIAPSSVLAGTTLASVAIRTLSTLVLTRLLSPHDYGLVSIINSIFFTMVMLTDLGFQSFVVRHPAADTQHFRNVIWTIHVIRGMILTAASALGAPLIAFLLNKPDLAAPLAAATLTLGINGIASLSLMTSLRSGGATRLSLTDLGLTAFQTLVAIVLAFALRNVWALILAMVAQSAIRAALSYTVFPNARQGFARDREISQEFIKFSRIVLISSSLMLLIAQSDKLFLARVLSLSDFGTYAIALNILSAPLSFVSIYMSRIVYPVYARTWNVDAADLKLLYYSARQRISVLFSIAVGIVAGGSSLLIIALYDPRYYGAASYVSLLAIGVALRLPNIAASEMMTAMGRPKVTVRLNLIRVIWLATAGPASYLLFGPIGVVGAVGLLELPALLESWRLLHRAGLFSAWREAAYLAAFGGGVVIGELASWTLQPFVL